jgi:hypothetical protein
MWQYVSLEHPPLLRYVILHFPPSDSSDLARTQLGCLLAARDLVLVLRVAGAVAVEEARDLLETDPLRLLEHKPDGRQGDR